VNVATRSTDIDTKHVEIISDKAGAQVESFILNLTNRNWMKQSKFTTFLNRMGHTRAKYGGVLVKKTEQDGELQLRSMQWLNMITDQVDIANGVKIERHYYTPADLRKMAGKWYNIDEAIDAAKKTREANAGRSQLRQNKTPGYVCPLRLVSKMVP
jgi:hypothetical protein